MSEPGPIVVREATGADHAWIAAQLISSRVGECGIPLHDELEFELRLD